jgi:hypothetical protein
MIVDSMFIAFGFILICIRFMYHVSIIGEHVPIINVDNERWNRMAYCSRDGVVFFPGESKSVPAADMKDLLYEGKAP